MPVATRITAEGLFYMPDEGPCELVKGELIQLSPTGGQHGRSISRIARLLDEFVEGHGLGTVFGAETGFVVARDPDTVRAPDAMFYSRERLDPDMEIEGFLPIPPDLAVEVVSPGDAWSDIEAKVEEYLGAGVPLVWVLDPRRRAVTVYPERKTLHEGDILDGGDVLPGFSCPVRRLFGRAGT